ncbi:leucine-rich melanocyte differentiation-associated protein-like [Tubulanus polymorphus]|uniref:leucine-rich melanocyte differentiation-associated protein-like n=1 Tax=Tubulanus polymorphus TaxID=672921 RepID=UPI003DA244C2
MEIAPVERSPHDDSTTNEVDNDDDVDVNVVFAAEENRLSCIGADVDQLSEDIISKYSELVRCLDLSFNQFSSLDDVRPFTHLEELVLDNNKINNNTEIPPLENLHTLMLNKNQISDLDVLIDKIRTSLPSLTYISLLGNLACPNQLSNIEKDDDDYQKYRLYLLHNLPNLKFIDASPVTDFERSEAERVGEFLKTVKARDDDMMTYCEPERPSPYTPLPENTAQPNGPVGSYGVSKYVYYGRHSEGNRFIRNTDL